MEVLNKYTHYKKPEMGIRLKFNNCFCVNNIIFIKCCKIVKPYC